MAENVVTLGYLARLIESKFTATAQEFSAVNHRLDMLQTSVREIAELSATNQEISVIHDELASVRQTVTQLRAKVEELRPDLNGGEDA
jgi:predicted nuclease with TOPRIM domain